MARPVCPKCEYPMFEMSEIEPTDSKFKFNAINCSSCGAVLAVVEFHNTGEQLKKIGEKLGV